MEATRHLFYKLRRYMTPACSETTVEAEFQPLCRDLLTAIGQSDGANRYCSERIQR